MLDDAPWMKLLSYSLALLLCASANAQRPPVIITIHYPISYSDLTPGLEPIQVAEEQGIPYLDLVKKAWHKDQEALAEFITNCPKMNLDGAASELHTTILLHLLVRWGDIDFAKVVDETNQKARKHLFRKFSTQEQFHLSFPDTSKALGMKKA